MSRRILIMGLPGAGKTYLAQRLYGELLAHGKTVTWLNADQIRKDHNDWNFSHEGRIRQAHRMRFYANESTEDFVIADFVAPLVEMRDIYQADWVIWVDSITEGRYQDTNKMFNPPQHFDARITEQNGDYWAKELASRIVNNVRKQVFDWQKPTVQMLGRWQPWHAGHRALFERAIEKTGQVVIQIRDCQGWNDSNPFAIEQVKSFIQRDLDMLYQGQYMIQVVPNITNITYGRDVGYKIEQEVLDAATESISATQIRKELNGSNGL